MRSKRKSRFRSVAASCRRRRPAPPSSSPREAPVSARDLEQRQSAVLSIELERVGLRRQAEALKRDISESTARLASIPIEIEAAQADSLSAEANLKQKSSDSEAHRAVFVLAPMGGRIAALPVSGGQPVSAGATLAVMTPADGRLEAELSGAVPRHRLHSRGAGGASAAPGLSLSALRNPAGKVKSVSGTVIGPSDVSIPGLSIHEPVFRVRVSLAAEEIMAYGQSHPLQPGMLLNGRGRARPPEPAPLAF